MKYYKGSLFQSQAFEITKLFIFLYGRIVIFGESVVVKVEELEEKSPSSPSGGSNVSNVFVSGAKTDISPAFAPF